MKNILAVLISMIIVSMILKKSLIKLNFICILEDYIKTFHNQEERISVLDLILFLLLPIFLGIISGNYFFITKSFLNTLLTVFSILLGLMLNLLVLILDKKSKKKLVNKLSNELFYSISFSILISILIVVSALLCSFDIITIKTLSFYIVLKKIVSMWIYSLIFLFCLDLFLILKRIHILLSYIHKEEQEEDESTNV